MKLKIALAAVAIAATTGFGLAVGAANAADGKDKVLVKVNGKEITERAVELAASEIGATDITGRFAGVPEAQRKLIVLDFLIKNELLASAAEKENLASGAGVDERVAYYRRRALRDAYFAAKVRASVGDKEAKALYDEIANQEEVRARHILVKTEAEARDVIEKLNRGDEFAKLAKEISTGPSKTRGGDLGYFTKDRMVKPFAEAAFKMKKGDVSADPVKTRFGWHIIKLEDRRKLKIPPYDTLKERIIAKLVSDKARAVVGALRGAAKIEYVDAATKKMMSAPRGSLSGVR